MSSANYVLVRSEDGGSRTVLAIGRTATTVASENLAQMRQQGAILGADEVHLHVLALTDAERAAIEFDLNAGNNSSPPAGPVGRPN